MDTKQQQHTGKSAVIVFFDGAGHPVNCRLACTKDQEPQLEKMARQMIQAIEGPHVCQCGGKCTGET